jgi:AAA domain, putative AbiEii toxin, Type IV TA system/AAA domain
VNVIESSAVPKIASIELKNIRGFEHLVLDFEARRSADPTLGNTAVIIGQNGTNKSTLLRSIALGLASSEDAAAMLSSPMGRSLGRIGATESSISVSLRDDSELVECTKRFTSDDEGRDRLRWESSANAEQFSLLVCGYGAGRGVTGTDSGRSFRLWDGVESLFDYRAALLSPELTLRRLRDFLGERDHYEKTIRAIARMVGFEDEDTTIVVGKGGGGISFSGSGVGLDVPLECLADGYRVAFNWIVDIYGRALSRDWITREGSIAALVLVDEIDQHLHPELQVRVVSELERTFPDSTFIVTTHSPLVALGCNPSQLVPLQRKGQTVTALSRVPDYRGFSPEEMLSNDRLFGTEALNPEFQALVDKRNELSDIGPHNRNDGQDGELREAARAITKATQGDQFAAADERFELLLSQKK